MGKELEFLKRCVTLRQHFDDNRGDRNKHTLRPRPVKSVVRNPIVVLVSKVERPRLNKTVHSSAHPREGSDLILQIPVTQYGTGTMRYALSHNSSYVSRPRDARRVRSSSDTSSVEGMHTTYREGVTKGIGRGRERNGSGGAR
jgi:hypothetical protein